MRKPRHWNHKKQQEWIFFRGQRIKIVEGGDTTASNQGPLLGFGSFEREMPKVEIDQNQMRPM